jgi:hypothetical protein
MKKHKVSGWVAFVDSTPKCRTPEAFFNFLKGVKDGSDKS